MKAAKEMKREEFIEKWGASMGHGFTDEELSADLDSLSLPPAEGAEEILASIVESLGEPTNIHNHVFEIRPYTVEHKTEWWIFHKEVSSGEPLAQWLSKFATLHAQKIADKMAEGSIAISPYNLSHVELDTDCCGVFTVLRDDGIIVCNECGMELHTAVKVRRDELRDELEKYELYHKNDVSSAIRWVVEYLKQRQP